MSDINIDNNKRVKYETVNFIISAACLAVIIGDIIYVAIFFDFSINYFIFNLSVGFIPAIIGGAVGRFIKKQFELV